MKKLILSGLLSILAFSLFGETISNTLTVKEPTQSRKNGNILVEVENSIYLTRPGNPEIPSIPVKLVLPPGEEAVAITIEYLNTKETKFTGNLAISQTPVPLSQKQTAKLTKPNRTVFQKDALYPNNEIIAFENHFQRGYSIVTFHVNPIQVNPVQKTLLHHQKIHYTVETKATSNSTDAYTKFYRGKKSDRETIRPFIQNETMLHRYTMSTQRNNENLLAIITDAQFVSLFEDYIEMKTKQGFNPIITTVQDIETSYTGIDTPEKIRNYVIDVYQNNGTEYVLLAGDDEFLPHRGFYLVAGETVDEDLPSDLYFAGLDRAGNGMGPDWDTNNNGLWGEHNEADYLAEVAIGRIAASDNNGMAAALNKQMMYQYNPVVSDLENALMVGEELNDNPQTNGGDYKDQIVNGGTYDGFSTTGIADNFNVESVYDRDMYWTYQTLAEEINQGVNILNHLGHSFTQYNMKFENWNVTDDTFTANGINHNFTIVYSQGCYPGAFDNRGTEPGNYMGDCIAEKFTTINNGIVAFVGNTRYGWYSPGGTNSSSQFLDRYFFHYIFEGVHRIGDVNNASKAPGVDQCAGDPWFRWSYYEVTLFGDPTLSIWTSQPAELVVTMPEAVPVGTNSLSIDTGIPNAIVGISADGEHLVSGETNTNGQFTGLFSPVAELGMIDVWITADNHSVYQGQVSIVAPDTPYLVLDDMILNTEDGDDLIEVGETISVDLALRNIGNFDADTATLSTGIFSDSNINITNLTESIPAVGPLASYTLENAIEFTVNENAVDQYQVTIPFNVSGGNHSSTFNARFTLAAPILAIQDFDLDIVPGTTRTASFILSNSGSADLNNAVLEFDANSDFCSVVNGTETITNIASNETYELSFDVAISEHIQNAQLVTFELEGTTNEEIDIDHSYIMMYGGHIESFESDTFEESGWEYAGDADWVIVDDEANDGSYSIRSGNVDHNQDSEISIQIETISAGQISFARKVSCENDANNNYDFLAFKINGIEQARWDGDTTWNTVSFDVSQGTNVFSWVYHKDPAVSNGQDCAWIDDVQFPPFIPTEYPIINLSDDDLDFGIVAEGSSSVEEISIDNFGMIDLQLSADVPAGFTLNGSTETLSLTITPGQTEMIEVAFNPTTAGLYDCALVLVSNDPFNIGSLIEITASTGVSEDGVPQLKNALLGNFPNPFNPTTSIKFTTKNNNTNVNIDIYDIRGRKVKSLLNNTFDQGLHSVIWNGDNDQQQAVGSGVYFYKAQIGSKKTTKRMLLLK